MAFDILKYDGMSRHYIESILLSDLGHAGQINLHVVSKMSGDGVALID